MLLVAGSVTLGSLLQDGGGQPTLDVAAPTPEPGDQLVPSPPPRPLKLASHGGVNLYLPINAGRVTAIDYHAVHGSSALRLDPSGRVLNGGILDHIERQVLGDGPAAPAYFVSNGSTDSVDVGARAGTQVYAPVTGTIAGITPFIVSGRAWGSVITVLPVGDPTVVVAISHLHPDPALRVGSTISAQPPTLLGTVADLSGVLRMDLARYTADAGNHVHIEVRPAEVLAVP
jgi:hypothetical protein